MFTVKETPLFKQRIDGILSEEERLAFIVWLANNPFAGDVITETGGLRKVRWARQGTGKSGGLRAIYYNVLENGEIWLLMPYTKSKFDTLPEKFLRKLLKEVMDG